MAQLLLDAHTGSTTEPRGRVKITAPSSRIRTQGLTAAHSRPMEDIEGITWIAAMVVTTISDWIAAARLRRRVRPVFGRDVTELELTSFTMWMKVEEEEEKSWGGKMAG